MKKILLIHYKGCIPAEVVPFIAALSGIAEFESASPDGRECKEYREAGVTSSLAFAFTRGGRYEAILIPGGDPESQLGNEELNRVLTEGRDALLVAICAGPLLLDQAGLLKGHRFSHGYRPEQIEWLRARGYFADALPVGDDVSVDGKILTANVSGAKRLVELVRNRLIT